MELIRHYFPHLTPRQLEQVTALGPLFTMWNERINVISRKDIGHLYLHHVLHSLVLAKYNAFEPDMRVLDAGTGGGFPGIPLAIMFPDVHFTLLDATAKKTLVAKSVATEIGLDNCTTVHARMEAHTGEYDIVVSRAVSTLSQMMAWTRHLVPAERWIILKGGDPREWRKEIPPQFQLLCTPVQDFFAEPYFEGKYIVDIRRKKP